jgi:ATP-dependent helicase HrpA
MSSPAEPAAVPETRPARPEARSRRSKSGRSQPTRSGSVAARAARRAAMPPISYPPELPVSQLKDQIAEAIRDHQVVIIAGETGSGKTTQIPKICLELGRGVNGQIGHTQPRRLAARTVAERIAEELGSPLGQAVGYQVRFTDVSAADTLIKLMTDGILLTELARDRQLRQYDTLIIDEAHERSLNVDFILGYLRQLLPNRPDLKVIITSATIDPERFAEAFGGAPIIEVSGRTYPVELRYRPAEDADQGQAILDAIDELSAEGPGDILVFLSGEREIRDTADLLAGRDRLEVLPLYSRLSAAEQHRVFEKRPASSFTRRVVLATNVAETSLTVPGIHYVIDPGTARISRYSRGTKVQRLPIEPISQASANQRKGRSGRTADGICIRLYSREDFESRPEFTEPEILRTNLASVILQMAAIGLGDVPSFPFIDPPDARNIADGLTLLAELHAFSGGKITGLGRRLARLPVDPRIGRMILEADRNGCVREVLIIASALSIQDPRERPADAQQAADDKHRRFADPGSDSDFSAYLNLWDYLAERQRELSSSAFRRLCRAEYLNYLRVREWQDLHGQLQRLAADLGVAVNSSSAERTVVHQSLLAGLLSQIGMKAEPARVSASAPGGRGPGPGRRPRAEYLGARNARFAIFPGSSLARRAPDWIVAAELVETSRLWARTVARIEPEWVEPLARHLVKRSYSEPHWEKKRGSAVALEKVTLYGVPLVTDRPVGYGRIDPAAARELFIRHALVEGDWQTSHKFFAENRRLLAEAEQVEHRARRRGLVVGEDELFAFYDARIPADVTSAQHFDTWWKQARRNDPGLLTFEASGLLSDAAAEVSPDAYPDVWTSESPAIRALPLSYAFEPGTDTDGVTVDIPLSRLNQVDPAEFSWQVPGLRTELVAEMIRSLPKALRRDLVPAPDVARDVVARLGPPSGDLRDAVARELRSLRGVTVPRDAWDLSKLPPHLRITVRVTDGDRLLAEGKDVAELQRELRPRLRAVLSRAAAGLTRSGLTSWDFGELPRVFKAGTVVAYPALFDAGTTVDIRLFETETAARSAMWAGTRRLILLGAPSPVKSIAGRLSTRAKLALSRNPHGSVAAMLADCVNCAADHLMAEAGGPAWDREGFERLSAAVRSGLYEATAEVVTQVESALRLSHSIETRLDDLRAEAVLPAVADMRAQLSGLIYPGFVTATGYRRLSHLTRYLQAMERRLDKLPDNPARDAASMAVAQRVEKAYRQAVADLPAGRRDLGGPGDDADVADARWMLEELRVSLFAQTLGTLAPVSENRVLAALGRLRPQ